MPNPCFVSMTQKMELISESSQRIPILTERLRWGRFHFPPWLFLHLGSNTLNRIGIQLLDYLVTGSMPRGGAKRDRRGYFVPEDLKPARHICSYLLCTGFCSWLSFAFLLFFSLLVWKCWYGDFLLILSNTVCPETKQNHVSMCDSWQKWCDFISG